ncbi:C2H2-type zinc finger protein isoform X2 [Xyrauchen texanus]|uniref:C2H2-type zinc finger protein isoform X2 n=1 Tax=Xyrauchen texanus TaxID=154827 RepID=UPI0022425DA0|nr:C2H2-type zinc finger protein isoform X2 [Xyrauchen texanus]
MCRQTAIFRNVFLVSVLSVRSPHVSQIKYYRIRAAFDSPNLTHKSFLSAQIIPSCDVTFCSGFRKVFRRESSGVIEEEQDRNIDHKMLQPNEEYDDISLLEPFAVKREVENEEVLVIRRVKGRKNTASKPHYCSQCGKSFNLSAQLTRHMRIHSGDKPYKCSKCEMCFRTKENLSEHIHIHTDQRPYTCYQCGKGFLRPGRLEIHKRIHTGEKPHNCAQCRKSFKSPSELQLHTAIHTGEKHYYCSQCEMSFRRSGHLTRHMRIHTGERPFQCAQCGTCFSRAEHLRGHQVTVHRQTKQTDNLEE